MQDFFKELMKRKVIQVAVVYLVVAWVVMQIVDVMFPALGLPDWTITLAAALLIIGFPVALVLSWAYDLSPDGLRRESDSDGSAAPAATDDTDAGRQDPCRYRWLRTAASGGTVR